MFLCLCALFSILAGWRRRREKKRRYREMTMSVRFTPTLINGCAKANKSRLAWNQFAFFNTTMLFYNEHKTTQEKKINRFFTLFLMHVHMMRHKNSSKPKLTSARKKIQNESEKIALSNQMCA